MTASHEPPAVDIGVTTGWIVGSCVAAFCLGFSASAIAELVVYDVPEATAWWDLDALVGSLAAWVTLMALSATRMRFDASGIHRRSLFRHRHWPWSEVAEVAVRPPRIPMVSAALCFRVADDWRETPWGVNAHTGGASGLLELVAPLAEPAGVVVSADAEPLAPLP